MQEKPMHFAAARRVRLDVALLCDDRQHPEVRVKIIGVMFGGLILLVIPLGSSPGFASETTLRDIARLRKHTSSQLHVPRSIVNGRSHQCYSSNLLR